MMGRFGVRGLLAISACMTMSAVGAVVAKAIAQPAKSEELYYLSFGQKIPLKIKENVIAVEGKPSNQLSGGELYSRTLKRYLRGDNTLSGSNDNSNPPGVQIDSIGNRYALIGFSSTAKREQIQKNIKAEPNLNATLPVLNLGDRDSSMLVLPNRIVVGFKTGTSTEVIQKALKRQNVEIIRKETFAEGIYVVRSKGATGIAVLQVANQLSQEIGVEYATPDFIQIPGASSISPESQASESKSPDKLRDTLRSISPDKYSPTSPRYLPLQWNLDSFPLRQCLAATNTWDCLFKDSLPDKSTAVKRTDIRAKEAWKVSDRKGRGVVVAVIDAFVQSDHPDLVSSVYQVDDRQCPKAIYGWDFTNETVQGTGCEPGDPEPAIDTQEAEDLREKLSDVLSSNIQLIQKYPKAAEEIQKNCQSSQSNCSPDEVGQRIRVLLRSRITGSFHGTNVTGVISANSSSGKGLVGVAPNAKILPLRAMGSGGGVKTELAVARAIGYAASRKADIINLSLGYNSLVNDQTIAKAITTALATNPNLVIVASAGNEAESIQGRVMFPACIPGVISVGSTNLLGRRAKYSNFGYSDWSNTVDSNYYICGLGLKNSYPNLDNDDPLLDVVAPGGEMEIPNAVEGISTGGVFTTGGTFASGLWRGLTVEKGVYPFKDTLDQRGQYIWTEGTSFSAPAVAGVIALMKAEDSERKLTRQQLVKILKQTASYESLDLGDDMKQYNESKQKGILPVNISSNQYFFGAGLVNAEAAVREVKRQLGRN